MNTLVMSRLVVVAVAWHWSVQSAPVQRSTVVGRAAVAGTLVELGDGKTPVRRAIVSISGLDSVVRSAITDDEGRFLIEGLPAGTYRLKAVKPGYLNGEFGSTRVGAPGVPVQVTDGQKAMSLTFGIAHGAALSGTVRDTRGFPLQNTRVAAFRRTPGLKYVATGNVAFADDRGCYRIFGLPPGRYIVVATFPFGSLLGSNGSLAMPDIDRTFAALRRAQRSAVDPLPNSSTVNLAPVFFPGVLSATQTVEAALDLGADRAGMDITMIVSTTAAVEGSVASVPNRPGVLSIAMMALGPDLALPPVGAPSLQIRPTTNGSFRFVGVNPGSYVIVARWSPSQDPKGEFPNAPSEPHWARAAVEVGGGDVGGVSLVLQPAPTVRGRVLFDATRRSKPTDLTRMRVVASSVEENGLRTLLSLQTGLSVSTTAYTAAIGPNGSFEFSGVIAGRYRLQIETGPTGFWPRSARANGRDLLDYGLEIEPGALRIPEITITMSDRRTAVVGTVSSAVRPPSTYFIVVFPADRMLWHHPSRRIQVTRADNTGAYSLSDLPPGEYFLGAVSDFAEDDLSETAFLDSLVGKSIRLVLSEGEQKRQDIGIGGV
jgi:hypothetical protein